MKNYILVLITTLLFACNTGSNNSDTLTEDKDLYLPDNPDFPLISITTINSKNVTSKEDYLDANIDISGIGIFDDISSTVRVRGRGNSTWLHHPKKSYQIKFDDKTKILDMPKDKKWILLANHSDKSLLRNELAFDLSRLSSLDWTPESEFAEVVLNNNYRGLYQVTQKVEESSRRVDIGDDGFLLEVDQLDRLDEDDVYFETRHYLFNIKEPSLEHGDEQYEYISSRLQEIEDALTGDNFLDPEQGYAQYIDVDSVIDWYLVNEIAKNQDAIFYSSVYMSLIPGEKLKMGPVWDFDIGFGNSNNTRSMAYDPEGFWVKRSAWMSRMFKDPRFINRVKERFSYFKENKELMIKGISNNADYLSTVQARNFDKWDILGKYVWPNYVYFESYEEEKDYLIEWLEARFQWLDGAINEL